MRVVALCSGEWAGRFLVRELAISNVGLTDVLFETDPLRSAQFSVRGAMKAARVYGRIPAARAFLGMGQHSGGAFRFFPTQTDAPSDETLRNLGIRVTSVPDARSPESQAILQQLQPDVVVICGTLILPIRILQIAKLCTLNIHTSVLPHYRGGGSLFWPLFFRDTDPVGFTIHEAVAEVDAGRFLAQERVPVEMGNTPQKLLRKCFKAAAPRLVQILRGFQNGQQPEWKKTPFELDFAWRAPDPQVRRYRSGRNQTPVFSVAKRIASKLYLPQLNGNGVAVLYLHRILDPSTPKDDWRRVLGHPDQEELLSRISYLRRNCDLISLSEALNLISSGSKTRGRFTVLTVDDGYRDFYTHLLPILEAEKIAATLFVCSGAVESGTIWYQQLYDLIDGVKSDRLRVPFADRNLYFGDVRHRVLTIERVIAKHLKRLKLPKLKTRMAELLEANPIQLLAKSGDEFCTVDDLIAMTKSRFVEMHLHSHQHHPFERLSADEAADDLSRCTDFFRKKIGINSTVMSYPNGESRDDLIPVLQSSGIEWAFSTRPGIERGPAVAPYFMRRLSLDSAPIDWFARRLSREFRGA